jgi:SAM-dependent methyltransferase
MNKFRVKFFLTDIFIRISFLFSELADFFHCLPVAFLKPRDLVELNNRQYSKDYVAENWDKTSDTGLSSSEKRFCRDYGFGEGQVLVIGCGAGREAVVLAKLGFKVTAFDSSIPMLDAAARNIEEAKLKVDLLPLSLYEINRINSVFDLVFLGANYGMIPSRELRQQVLISIKNILKPTAAVYLSFAKYSPSKYAGLRYCLYKAISYLFFGNIKVEKGDVILGTGEFYHYFDSAETVIREISAAGFSVEDMEQQENALFLKARS